MKGEQTNGYAELKERGPPRVYARVEKLRAAQERYWTRKAAEIAAKREKPPISGDSNEGTTNDT